MNFILIKIREIEMIIATNTIKPTPQKILAFEIYGKDEVMKRLSEGETGNLQG